MEEPEWLQISPLFYALKSGVPTDIPIGDIETIARPCAKIQDLLFGHAKTRFAGA